MRKPRNYWNIKKNCENEFLQYVDYCKKTNTIFQIIGLENYNYQAYKGAQRNGWLYEFIKKHTNNINNKKIRKSKGYWNNKEHCLNAFNAYVNHCSENNNSVYKSGFERFCKQAYNWSKKNGWLDDWISKYDNNNLVLHQNRDVYVYKFTELKAMYAGLSGNTKNRKRNHKVYNKSSVAKFAKENGCNIPKMKVVLHNLPEVEAQFWEDAIKKIYAAAGWKIINRAPTGVGIGSLGGNRQIPQSDIIKMMSNYSCLKDFRKDHQYFYQKYRNEEWFKNFSWTYSSKDIASKSKIKHTKGEYEIIKKEAEKAGVPLWSYNRNVYEAARKQGFYIK